jgi:2,3-bisphosphoglycerate-independent phosphoglycerate mutase
MSSSPVLLVILDGWGIRWKHHGNATQLAKTPNNTSWAAEYERSILEASGPAVGLPDGQMGNSEVGHLNLGAGRIVYQDIERVNKSFRTGEFGQLPVVEALIQSVREKSGKIHLIGLVSDGGVHSHADHVYALLDLLATTGLEVVVHAITDGRDTAPGDGIGHLKTLSEYVSQKPGFSLATVVGRYFAMDRDNRWERTQLAYDAIVRRVGEPCDDLAVAVRKKYDAGETDEFLKPLVLDKTKTFAPGDGVIFFNFRSDRMRQIGQALTDPKFTDFETEDLSGVSFASFTQYDASLPIQIIFPMENLSNPLAQVLSDHKKQQFHAAETEKYPHVTYFFNGRYEKEFPGETRFLMPSPKVATYDLKPEMSANELCDGVLARIKDHDDDFILVNFANPDMVGHTGVLSAVIKAIEVTDECVGRLVAAILAKNGVALVTADHGNAEVMIDELTGGPHTYHTTNPVALTLISKDYYSLRPQGILADVAPTVLDLLNVPKPPEMTGRSLILGKSDVE